MRESEEVRVVDLRDVSNENDSNNKTLQLKRESEESCARGLGMAFGR